MLGSKKSDGEISGKKTNWHDHKWELGSGHGILPQNWELVYSTQNILEASLKICTDMYHRRNYIRVGIKAHEITKS